MTKDWRAASIAGHAMLADGRTAALVFEDATIDWLCLPRFNGDVCFAALLGTGDNGGWWMYPEAQVTDRSRRYLGDSLVLETLFSTDDGQVAVIDFMPPDTTRPTIIRIVEGRRGTVAMQSSLLPRFSYGQTHPTVDCRTPREALALAGADALVLRADCDIDHDDRALISRFEVREGERTSFALSWYPSNASPPREIDPSAMLEATREQWQGWSGKTDYSGYAKDKVARSLVALKGLVCEETGGIVAAATSSLPERPGGARNWDYRFCWLRDAAFTLVAFLRTGHDEEAKAWIEWLRRALAGEPIAVQPFYAIDGKRHTVEWEADWLPGFGDARPVRFGNGAADQLQLDIFGEVIDTLYLADQHGIGGDDTQLVADLARCLEDIWTEPDAGIWEGRGGPQQHTYSNAMCWVAFDRAAKMLADICPEDAQRWHDLAGEVRARTLAHGFDEKVGAFTRVFDKPELDASVLRLPLVGFIDANDDRMLRTVAALQRELTEDGLLYRYASESVDDGVGGGEGAFVAVNFWLVDVLAMQGRQHHAETLFDRMAGFANDLGLLTEEIWVEDKRAIGNIPQALSHLALVNSALAIDAGGTPPRIDEPDG
ncbi:glycoside hydrolase family 15 protein [Porphyrobacter algicida]|uniref:Glycoside hydrolase family 15 protein n=1 Tax=Qipengyuania algicida TaxID=1836209 RepID=A0A845ABE9_9SPHN|nr:glycoside hydrolase family 15 protein [Qipengyuania algicida]MXP27762.1 glycoside hydrolase family 15 protein [Qipengyuania algicida]